MSISGQMSNVYASVASEPLQIVSYSIPEAATLQAKQSAPNYIETFLGAADIMSAKCLEGVACYIGNGYYVYMEQNGITPVYNFLTI